MVISIPVDAAYAFDYLSILWIKFELGKIDFSIILKCAQSVIDQLGEELYFSIMSSPEYKELKRANEVTFALVDLAKKDEVKASEVDKSNYDRYLAKQKLQQKFFGDNLIECKT